MNNDSMDVTRTPASLGAFMLGALVGAGVALLLAPATGSETRRRLGETAKRWGQQARDKFDEARDTIDREEDAMEGTEFGGQSTYEQRSGA